MLKLGKRAGKGSNFDILKLLLQAVMTQKECLKTYYLSIIKIHSP